MAYKPFKQIKVADGAAPTAQNFNDMQYNVNVAFQQILGKDQLDSSVVVNVSLLPGITNKVSHTLGRPLTGWIPIRYHGGYSIIWDTQDLNKSPHLLLFLNTPVSITVDLLVF